MAVPTVLEFPEMTREQHERLGVALARRGAPEGALYHGCGPTASGWRIADVWESREAFDRFVDGKLLPATRALGAAEPSRREVVPAHHAGAVRPEPRT